jgi:hypothetical protein
LLGAVVFRGADGSAFKPGADISVLVDGTPGANDMPAKMVFNTTPDGTASSVARMSIDNAGAVAVTGSAFSVGGSTLVVAGGLTRATKLVVGTVADNAGDVLTVTTGMRADSTGGIYTNFYSGTMRTYGTDVLMDIGTVGKKLTFRTSNAGSLDTSAMTMLASGNVGIGTTAPDTKLDISSGTIKMAGTGSPAKGYALCLTAAGKLSTCSNTPAADGTCTCTP